MLYVHLFEICTYLIEIKIEINLEQRPCTLPYRLQQFYTSIE
jgi:hypothetical protein